MINFLESLVELPLVFFMFFCFWVYLLICSFAWKILLRQLRSNWHFQRVTTKWKMKASRATESKFTWHYQAKQRSMCMDIWMSMRRESFWPSSVRNKFHIQIIITRLLSVQIYFQEDKSVKMKVMNVNMPIDRNVSIF